MQTDHILTVESMYSADKRAIKSGVCGYELMLAAGRACFEAAEKQWKPTTYIVVCGPGNNGGDGFVVAELARKAGRNVHLFSTHVSTHYKGDAKQALDDWTGDSNELLFNAGELSQKYKALINSATDKTVLVDAVFGAGLTRSLDGVHEAYVNSVSGKKINILSVDVPTGVNGNTGRLESASISADLTVTFAARKPAHCLYPAAERCGKVTVADIGIEDSIIAELSDARLNSPDLWLDKFPWPSISAYKHRRGKLNVLAGPAGATGAARLAARAGLRSGAGLLTLWGRPAAIPEMAASSLAVMTQAYESMEQYLTATADGDACVFGPAAGLTSQTRDTTLLLLRRTTPLVLDADSLSIFEGDAELLHSVLHGDTVVTPHQGEFRRIFPDVLASASSKTEAVSLAAKKTGAVVVLKGPDTVIASPEGRVVVNNHASSFLATAGSGDVLAGIIGGLMAQGMKSFDAACCGVWLHGDSALRLGPGLIAEDLTEMLPETLSELYELSMQKNT